MSKVDELFKSVGFVQVENNSPVVQCEYRREQEGGGYYQLKIGLYDYISYCKVNEDGSTVPGQMHPLLLEACLQKIEELRGEDDEESR